MKSSISVGGALLFSNSGPLASILLTFRIQIVFHFFPPQYRESDFGGSTSFPLSDLQSAPGGCCMVPHRAVGWGTTDPGSEKSCLPSGILHSSSGFARQLVSLLWNWDYLLSKGSTITSCWCSEQTSVANDPLKQVQVAGGNAGG